MRLLLLVLIALVALIQYPLWMGRGGWFAVWDLQEQVASQRSINDGLICAAAPRPLRSALVVSLA